MAPENFDVHIYSSLVYYYHQDLKKLIDSVTKEDKKKLEQLSCELAEKSGQEIKLSWGFKHHDKTIENVLSHISFYKIRQSFDLIEPEKIQNGHLKYLEHNIGTSDQARAPIFSILLNYFSILNKLAIRKL